MMSFEKLEAYQVARQYVRLVYDISSSFPAVEDFALTSQVRRAAVSITSNIAEGTSRTSTKDKVHFLEIAYGSLLETVSQMQIALDVHYITQAQYENIVALAQTIKLKLTNLRTAYQKTKQP